MVDVAVHGLDKLRATFIAFEGRLADGKCRHEVERIQAPFSVDLVGSGFPGGELLVAGLHGGQVFVVLLFKVFEPRLESAGIQLRIVNGLEGVDNVHEDTRGLVLVEVEGVRIFGKDLAEFFAGGDDILVGKGLEALGKVAACCVCGVAFLVKAAHHACRGLVNIYFNEVRIFGYGLAVGFDGRADFFALDAFCQFDDVLVEAQEFVVAESVVADGVDFHHDAILVLKVAGFSLRKAFQAPFTRLDVPVAASVASVLYKFVAHLSCFCKSILYLLKPLYKRRGSAPTNVFAALFLNKTASTKVQARLFTDKSASTKVEAPLQTVKAACIKVQGLLLTDKTAPTNVQAFIHK